MGTVIQLKNQINNSYFRLKESVDEKLVLVEEKIKSKLTSDIELVQKMTDYQVAAVVESTNKTIRELNQKQGHHQFV